MFKNRTLKKSLNVYPFGLKIDCFVFKFPVFDIWMIDFNEII